MSDYHFPYKDAAFLMNDVLDFDQLCADTGYDEVNFELAEAILEEASRFGSEVLVPINVKGDQQGATLGDDGVVESPGYAEAYRQYVDNGWASLSGSEEYGGQAMPKLLNAAVVEIWDSACVSFSLCGLLTTGAVEALEVHASEELKETYLPNLISGEWTGTMCLTEPAAGSDLAAVSTKAVVDGDHYLLTGQKIYITWGDHQMTDNVIHLVLARLPDAPPGVKGISLFLVPKFLLDENGNSGERNDVYCVGVEHKLGIHGSPTCTLNFGDNGGAVGYLIGEPHQGLMAMFTMMNDARQGVGIQSLAVAERAYQQAVTYAKDRIQGTRSDGSRFPITEFPDVRRMLMLMKAVNEAGRGLIYIAGAERDRADSAETDEQKREHLARTGVYTPIVKGWISELAQEVTYLAVQVHGGMGYIEETGVAQHYRDVRIMTIYEGTTGIQALDLAGRKTLGDGGAAVSSLLDEIGSTAKDASGIDTLAPLGHALAAAVEAAREASQWLVEHAKENHHAVGAASFNFMMLMGYVCGGWVMAQSAVTAHRMLEAGQGDANFLKAKLVTAKFYCDHLLPRSFACLETIKAGAESMMALDVENF